MSQHQNLLSLTQNILSGLSSDEINSISDTVESMQVATIIKNKYFDIIARTGFNKHEQTFQLTASTDDTKPTLMFMPANIKNIEWLKYFNSNVLDGTPPNGTYIHDLNTDLVVTNTWETTSTTTNTIATGTQTFTTAMAGLDITIGGGAVATSGSNQMIGTVVSYSGTTLVLNITSTLGSGTFSLWDLESDPGLGAPPGYQYVTILPIQQFLDMINSFNPTDVGTGSYTFSDTITGFNGDYTFYYKNWKQPQYCTVLNNYYVIFDSYDNTQDTTIQEDKTMAFGQVIPAWSMTDTFVPDIDSTLFPLLINEAKALAYFELKNAIHPKAEQELKRQWSAAQKSKNVSGKPSDFNALPDFGRRGSNLLRW